MENKSRSTRSLYFTYVLYPQEDNEHKLIFEFITSHYAYAYIKHPHEFDTDPKEHLHIIFKLGQQSTVNGVNKYFGSDYVQLVENLQSAMQYLVHDTPSCIREVLNGNSEKRQFPVSNIVTNTPKWLSLISQNSHYVQLEKLMDSVNNGFSLWEAIQDLPVNERASVAEYVINHTGIIQLSNQHINKLRYERGEI